MNEVMHLRRGVMPDCSMVDELNALFDAHDRRVARQVMVLRIVQVISFAVAVYGLIWG